jgi:hypothetical protein
MKEKWTLLQSKALMSVCWKQIHPAGRVTEDVAELDKDPAAGCVDVD